MTRRPWPSSVAYSRAIASLFATGQYDARERLSLRSSKTSKVGSEAMNSITSALRFNAMRDAAVAATGMPFHDPAVQRAQMAGSQMHQRLVCGYLAEKRRLSRRRRKADGDEDDRLQPRAASRPTTGWPAGAIRGALQPAESSSHCVCSTKTMPSSIRS